jgi:Putative abortive phage resistance protein AbiGi, antitoxin
MIANRPDFSNFLAHFTRDGDPFGGKDGNNPANEFAGMPAGERLVSILKGGFIRATTMPWMGRRAVCFTECPWSSLLDHANQYSSYAVGFSKPHVFAAGGGPVYYIRADHWEKQEWDDHLRTFVTPFWPLYRPALLKGKEYLGGKTVDYSHEREWRVPHDFSFSLDKIEFIILPTYKDMAEFPKQLKDAIGREKVSFD